MGYANHTVILNNISSQKIQSQNNLAQGTTSCQSGHNFSITHSLTAARIQLWVVAASMLTGRRQEPMRRQQ